MRKDVHGNVGCGKVDGECWSRRTAELLRSRVEMLDGKDKVLMTMYVDNGTSFRQMARLAGVSEVTVARRIRKMSKRLIEGRYIDCLGHRDKLSRAELDIAKDYFLAGWSMEDIADRRRRTYYHVRKTIQRIERLLENSQRGASSITPGTRKQTW